MVNPTAYQYELSDTQTLYIGGQGLTTTITLQSSQSGQQQQSSNQFSTGKWTAVPLLYQLAQSVVVVIATITETYYLQVQGTQMQMSTQLTSPQLEAQIAKSHPLSLQPAGSMPAMKLPAMTPIMTMEPMQPMEMPAMQPMQLKMGNMEMSMGGAANAQPSSGGAESNESEKVRRFCSQCGSAVQPEDNFCAYCGNKLS